MWGEHYCVVVSAAIFVCCLSIMTSTIRLAYGMARDDQLPLSAFMSTVSESLHTPIGACIIVGFLAAIPLLQYAGAAYIAIAATGMIYLSYFLGNLATLKARLNGWPRTRAPFSLGKWGIPERPRTLWGGSITPSSSRYGNGANGFAPVALS